MTAKVYNSVLEFVLEVCDQSGKRRCLYINARSLKPPDMFMLFKSNVNLMKPDIIIVVGSWFSPEEARFFFLFEGI